jgi:hypothetical protein
LPQPKPTGLQTRSKRPESGFVAVLFPSPFASLHKDSGKEDSLMRNWQLVIGTAVVAILATLTIVKLTNPKIVAVAQLAPQSLPSRNAQDSANLQPVTAADFTSRRPASARAGTDARDEDLSNEQAEKKAELVARQLESRFRNEAISAKWARETERGLLDSFASSESKAMGVAPPLDADIQCRSSMCRIQADYADDGAAADAALVYTMDIANRLPNIYRSTITNPDGTSRILLYAMR